MGRYKELKTKGSTIRNKLAAAIRHSRRANKPYPGYGGRAKVTGKRDYALHGKLP